MSDEPFGRQPRPVTVTLDGEREDVAYWMRELIRRAEFKGDYVAIFHEGETCSAFRIHPRAVND